MLRLGKTSNWFGRPKNDLREFDAARPERDSSYNGKLISRYTRTQTRGVGSEGSCTLEDASTPIRTGLTEHASTH